MLLYLYYILVYDTTTCIPITIIITPIIITPTIVALYSFMCI